MLLQGSPWSIVFGEDLNVGALTDNRRGAFVLPPLNLYATFRLSVFNYVGGSIAVKLRLGFTDADTATLALAPNGLDFTGGPFAANTNILQSVVIAQGVATPNVVGSPPIILPPRVAVFITTVAGTQLSYYVEAACLQVQ